MAATLVSDGRGRLPSDYVFDDADPAEVEALLEEPCPKDVPYQCLLVRRDATVVLVDTGLGAVQHPLGRLHTSTVRTPRCAMCGNVP